MIRYSLFDKLRKAKVSSSIWQVAFQASGDARIRVTIDDYSRHQTHQKTRNIVFIFVWFSGFLPAPFNSSQKRSAADLTGVANNTPWRKISFFPIKPAVFLAGGGADTWNDCWSFYLTMWLCSYYIAIKCFLKLSGFEKGVGKRILHWIGLNLFQFLLQKEDSKWRENFS